MGPIIDLTQLFPWRILFLLCNTINFFYIYKSILKDKVHPAITFSLIFASRIITSVLLYNNELNSLGYVAFALLCFIIIIFLTEGKIYDKLFVTIISLITHFSASMLNVLIEVTSLGGRTYEEVYGTENQNLTYLLFHLTGCIIYIIFGILIAGLLKLYKQKRSKKKSNKLLIYLSFFPVTHIFTIIIPLSVIPAELDNKYLETSTYIIIYIFIAIIMLFDCSFPLMINYFEKITEQNNEYEQNILKNAMDYHQILMMKKEKQEFRKIKHDFTNIITTASGFIEIGKPDKALNILTNANDDLLGLAGFSICSNETINTIIYIKQQQAEKNHIKMTTIIEEEYIVRVDDYDLCRLLHNIIDNSLNAASKIDDNRYCNINISINEDSITIKSENGFNKSKKITKAKTGEHGNGIGIINEIVSKYGGKYASRQFNDTWYTEAYLSNKKPENSTPPPEFWLNYQTVNYI